MQLQADMSTWKWFPNLQNGLSLTHAGGLFWFHLLYFTFNTPLQPPVCGLSENRFPEQDCINFTEREIFLSPALLHNPRASSVNTKARSPTVCSILKTCSLTYFSADTHRICIFLIWSHCASHSCRPPERNGSVRHLRK